MLKTYHSRDNNTVGVGMCKAHGDTSMTDRVACDKSLTEEDVPSDDTAACQDTSGMEDVGNLETPVRLSNSEVIANIDSKLDGLSVEQKQQLKDLIQQDESTLPDVANRTNAAVHDIDVGDSKPFKQHPYRVGPVKVKQMKEEIDYMLAHDIINLSNSEWSSPCVLVPKPDGSIRFCTDYRRVNAITKGDTYPLPRILDCIDSVGNAKYVTKIDLLKGYWCVPLTKRAREISAFVMPFGLYSYNVMAFGLKNAPARFQRLINQIDNGLDGVEAYLDDLVVHSNSWEEHLIILQELFARLTKAQMTVNLAKSDFCKATVTYLGHNIGQGQVKPLDSKV